MATPTYVQDANSPIKWTCSICGASVSNITAHTAWHVAGVV